MSERHINLFSGSPLNRLSWLRPSQIFLNAIIEVPSTRWILFKSGEPLMVLSNREFSPAYLCTSDVRPILGPQPYFGQGRKISDLLPDTDTEHSPTQSARHRGPRIVFVGLQEPTNVTSEFTNAEDALKKLEGTPYFSADISSLEYTPEELQEFLDNTTLGREGKVLTWTNPRALISTLDAFTAGVFASAKSLVDWNLRNKFCPGCGSPSYSMLGGWKITCTTLLPWADKGSDRRRCFTATGLQNFTYPRTDAVVIMIAIDETGDKILLGRNRRYPGRFYSALSGFIEPGESLEDAVAREVWEEAGVRVWNVKYHSGQPWPYPANLMLGFYARADSTKPIRTDLDKELIDARWFTRREIDSVVSHKKGSLFRQDDYQKMNETIDGRSNIEQSNEGKTVAQALYPSESGVAVARALGQEEEKAIGRDEPPFKIPPETAIAGVIIRDWVAGKIGFPPGNPGI